MRTITLLLLFLSERTWSVSVGWKSYIKENPTEFQDLPLTWDLETPIPDWLSGTYIRNGPAQISFESSHRHLASWLEGFAKLHSFKISGSKVLYSGKMLESPNYVASREKGEMVPMMTLNKFADPEDEWNWWEKLQIMVKMFAGTEFDGSNKTDTTDIFVVDTKTGSVLGPFHTDWIFSLHHINAYENEDNEIILDLTPSPFENMREYLRLENILNPPLEGSPEAEVSTTDKLEITRYKINLKSGKVINSHFPNTINSRYINTFDFPTINEAYRGKKYCYVYGVSAFAYSRTALVKKNVCNPEDDKVYYLEDHYMTEMHFLPNPASRAEDDGVLITIGFSGVKEQSYLLLIDATTFLPINTAFLPHNIPWSAHGMHFPEATWSLNGGNQGLKEEL